MLSKPNKLRKFHNQTIFIAHSKIASIFVIFFYSMMVLGILITNLWLFLRALVALFLWLDCYRVLTVHTFGTSKFSVVCLQYDCGRWLYQLRNTRCYKAQLQRKGTFCCAWFLILTLRSFSCKRSVFIPRGAISEYNYRWLSYRINCL